MPAWFEFYHEFYTMQLADPQLGMINCCGPQEGPSKPGAVGRARLRVHDGGLPPPLAAPRRDPRDGHDGRWRPGARASRPGAYRRHGVGALGV